MIFIRFRIDSGRRGESELRKIPAQILSESTETKPGQKHTQHQQSHRSYDHANAFEYIVEIKLFAEINLDIDRLCDPESFCLLLIFRNRFTIDLNPGC
jgi:hypothetical protein